MVSTTDEVVAEVAPAVLPKEIDMENITEQDVERAQKIFQLGKKNLFLNKYDESANNIGEACDIFTAKYGELDARCAELYFFYGRALLELARVENTVLGNALNGVTEEDEVEAAKAASLTANDSRYGNPDDVAEDEKKEISDQVLDAMCEKEPEVVKPAAEEEVKVEEKKEVVEEKPAAKEAKKVEETPAAAETSEKPTTSAEEEEDSEDSDEDDAEDTAEDAEEDPAKAKDAAADKAEDEDVSNLQRAWEMFELAKVVYQKHFNDEPALKNKRIAECLLKLGEIGCEQEFYEQACGDIAESIRLQESVEDRDERMLAESYYQLGLAQQLAVKLAEAREAFQRAINILQLRVEKLKGKLLLAAESKESDVAAEMTTWRDEIADIEALLPDMTSKLDECNDQPAQMELIKEAKECFTAAVTAEAEKLVNGSAEVKDITQLVKSKRKMAECEPELESSKKTRLSGDLEEAVPEAKSEVVMEQEKPLEQEIPVEMNKLPEALVPPAPADITA